MYMYYELSCLTVWKGTEDSNGRRWEPDECGRRENCVDGHRGLGNYAVRVASCANVRVTCKVLQRPIQNVVYHSLVRGYEMLGDE